MKILVTVKRVEDYESKIKVKPDGSWIVTEGVNYRANPFDEIGVEEAIRLREAGIATEIIAIETTVAHEDVPVLARRVSQGMVKPPRYLPP